MKPWSGIRLGRALGRGAIVQWMDDKGYGWMESGQNRFFVHIKDFRPSRRRPAAGDEVLFVAGEDAKGRPCAKRVTFVKADKARISERAWAGVFLLSTLPLLALQRLPFPWWMGAGAMLLASAVTYFLYAHDKQQAVSSKWRVPEKVLHLGELLGGWPGALLAQRGLRHKCKKGSFQFVFWMIVLSYQAAALDLLLDHRPSRELMEFLAAHRN
jgi:uncharacterized membrane protein YsdA (DUF1294 family)/cold shock CspA family protein